MFLKGETNTNRNLKLTEYFIYSTLLFNNIHIHFHLFILFLFIYKCVTMAENQPLVLSNFAKVRTTEENRRELPNLQLIPLHQK